MNYDVFLKSKRIAQQWGEAQAMFKTSEHLEEITYYFSLLSEFYNYIQLLEKETFENKENLIDHSFEALEKHPSQPNAYSEIPQLKSSKIMPDTYDSHLKQQAVSTDEEDPWFGFSD
ncbi:MAG: hypothetical protein WAX22_08440 [Lactococcus hircilactis]|uniref:hypothetical protein n=1 Tax=Lactococcus hircilactis TaxID=1494462 RepID=UPI003BC31755